MAGSIDAISCTPTRKVVAPREEDRSFYECFFGEPVPFYQIVYHGLLQYHLYDIQSDTEQEFLREIEYGAMPRIATLWENKGKHLAWLEEWLPTMKKQYDVLCRELGYLQFEFMENHRAVAPGVFETTYSDGTRIVVNYLRKKHVFAGKTVPARWFARIPGKQPVSHTASEE